MATLPCRVITLAIEKPAAAVYAFASNPLHLTQWAAGIGTQITPDGDRWRLSTPAGDAFLRFEPPNSHFILDHWVTTPAGQEVYVPMRLVPNGDGCLVVFVLYQQPNMNDDQFAQDSQMVENDLKTLKALMEEPTPAAEDAPSITSASTK